MNWLKKRSPLWLFALMCSVLYIAVFTSIEFAGMPFSGVSGFFNLAFQYAVVAVSSAALIFLLSSNKYLFAVGFPVLTLLSTAMAYYRLTMGIYLSPLVIELMVVNDMGTWSTVISWQVVLVALLAVAVAVFFAWYRWKRVDSRHPWICAVVSLFVMLVPNVLVNRLKAPVTARMPYVFYYAVTEYLDGRKNVEEERHTFDRVEVAVDDDAPDVVFVIGESARADHFSLNGYGRLTNPQLAKDSNVISFPNVFTEPCYTHTSVPHILTRADSINPDRSWEEQSFITLFKKGGYATDWVSNQDMNPNYIYFINEADRRFMLNTGFSVYSFTERVSTPRFCRGWRNFSASVGRRS